MGLEGEPGEITPILCLNEGGKLKKKILISPGSQQALPRVWGGVWGASLWGLCVRACVWEKERGRGREGGGREREDLFNSFSNVSDRVGKINICKYYCPAASSDLTHHLTSSVK